MKKVLMLLFIGAVALMGYRDGGDVTGAVVLGMLALPSVFERKILRQAQNDTSSVTCGDTFSSRGRLGKGGKVKCQIRTEGL